MSPRQKPFYIVLIQYPSWFKLRAYWFMENQQRQSKLLFWLSVSNLFHNH